jgi:hypothetical protein
MPLFFILQIFTIMAYNKREFIQQAAINFGAAMVKVMDEQSDGIVDNAAANQKVSENATELAFDLAETLEIKYEELYEDSVFDEEV